MQTTTGRCSSLILVILMAGCATSPLEVSREAEDARLAGNHAKAAENYARAAEMAKDEKNADLEAMYLLEAADSRALVNAPGSKEQAIQEVTRARELFRNPGASSFSKEDRTAQMARTWVVQAGIVSKSDSTQARQYLENGMSICRGAMATKFECNVAARQASKIADQLGGGRLKFDIEYAELRQPIQSRMFYYYDTLIASAKLLGLTGEAAEIANAKAAVLAVEGASPHQDYLAPDANGNRRNIAELDKQAQRYSELGIEWLAIIRRAQAEEVSTHLGNIVGLERMTEENRERKQSAREQSLKDLQRMLEIRGAQVPRTTSPGTAGGSTGKQPVLSECSTPVEPHFLTKTAKLRWETKCGRKSNQDPGTP